MDVFIFHYKTDKLILNLNLIQSDDSILLKFIKLYLLIQNVIRQTLKLITYFFILR